MIGDARNPKISAARLAQQKDSVDVSMPVLTAPNAQSKTAGFLSEPGRCET
jgi:hypothetical protein